MNNFMRIMVFFDLPVKSKSERYLANSFRRFLINDGYFMLQYSVYSRVCNTFENANNHCNRLMKVAPKDGAIRCLIVTEKQYASMKIICGKRKKQEENAEYLQMTFL